MESGAQAAGGGVAGFSGVGDPSGFANAPPPVVPGLGASRGADPHGGHFPATTYTTFETGALPKVESKIRETDAEMAGQIGKVSGSLRVYDASFG